MDEATWGETFFLFFFFPGPIPISPDTNRLEFGFNKRTVLFITYI